MTQTAALNCWGTGRSQALAHALKGEKLICCNTWKDMNDITVTGKEVNR